MIEALTGLMARGVLSAPNSPSRERVMRFAVSRYPLGAWGVSSVRLPPISSAAVCVANGVACVWAPLMTRLSENMRAGAGSNAVPSGVVVGGSACERCSFLAQGRNWNDCVDMGV
jgi:hypothetical protein